METNKDKYAGMCEQERKFNEVLDGVPQEGDPSNFAIALFWLGVLGFIVLIVAALVYSFSVFTAAPGLGIAFLVTARFFDAFKSERKN